ncbi:hypothetical protein BWI17_14550 [Betaproteobacteria bacterium GR16-43]|nr:hypothetical protein BWI17_14550 [Betaproteobacteria bacterium GR16-43]
MSTVLRLAAALAAALSLSCFAQTPPVAWNVSTYGPGTSPATIGCGGCASDQRSIAVDAQGNVFVSGYTDTVTNSDMLLVKYDGATGAVLWSATYNGPGDLYEQAWALALDPSGNPIVSGYAYNLTTDQYEFKTIKYNGAAGTIAWQNNFPGPVAGTGYGIALGTDAAGNVYAAGKVTNGMNDDAKILKLAAATGVVLWDKTFAGVSAFNDYWFALAVDGNGNVIVTGEEQLSDVDSNWNTIKYAAANGAILWQAEFSDPAGGIDVPYAVRRDSNNDVVIVGVRFNGATRDGQVIKYSGATGAIVWSKTYPGTEFGDDFLYALAFDAANNVVVAGMHTNGEESQDWVVLKYAAANGNLLWEKVIGTGEGLADAAFAVAVDAQGGVFVAGRMNQAGVDATTKDIGSVKLDGTTGALIWKYTYDGSAHLGDRVAGIALVPGGVVIAGESIEAGMPSGLRVIKLTDAIRRPEFDFEGNARSDLLWRHTDGRAAIWLMQGANVLASSEILGAGTGWSVSNVADLDGNGKSDLVWQHTDGRAAVYLMNGATPTASAQILNAATGWTVTHTPDLNGDGKADLLFRNTNGSVAAWTMNGTAMTAGATIIGAGTGWSVILAADFDGDRKTDLLWRHTDGRHAIWLMNGLAVASTKQILGAGGWTATHAVDLNGDGRADIVWRHTDGTIAAYLMNGTTVLQGSTLLGAGSGWSVAGSGDFDGDRQADLLFQHTDGRAAIWLMSGLATTAAAQVLNAGGWSARRVQDLDGDGKADIVWEHTDGSVAVWLMTGTAMASGQGVIGPASGWRVSGASP